jgi:hypothetical protein
MMKHLVFSVMVVLAVTSLVNASITAINCAADGDGVISMSNLSYGDLPSTDVTMTMDCVQTVVPGIGAVGHIEGDFTGTETDPSVFFKQDIENDTGFDWTGYTMKIGMSHDFTFVTGLAYQYKPAGWSVAYSSVAPGITPSGSAGYVGTVTFTGGDPILDGDPAAPFGFKINWTSGSSTFCIEQTPVPEPISLLMFGLGGLALVRLRK